MPTAAVPDLPDELAPATGLFQTLLAIAPIGIVLMRPLYAADDAASLVDFAFGQLNPAARQMLGGLPERPAGSLRTLFPSEQTVGGFAFYRRAFLSGQAERYQQLYQADGYDGYYQVVAKRYEDQLVVTFTDTNEQPRSAVEEALRASQARERAALAEAELQRQRFYDVLQQLPAQVAIHTGPDHVYSFVNQRFTAYVPAADALGRPVRELAAGAMSEDVLALFDQVYQTGVVAQAHEVAVQLPAYQPEAPPVFVDTCYQPLRDGDGHIYGVLDFSYDVTEQVLARRQVEQLNAELETRVAERTQVAEQALAEAEAERQRLVELVEQAPAALGVLGGPDLVYEAFNPLYAAMFGGRPQVGRAMGEVLPEVVTHPGFLALREVYEHGRTIRQSEVLVPIARPGDGVLEDRYFSYTQQPRYDRQGQVDGVFVFAVEVTEQVVARRQVEQLNQELETRVRERTQQAEVARATAERERELLQTLFAQAPVAIALFQGPQVRVASANEQMAALWGRTPAQVVGRPLLVGVPELAGQGFDTMIREVETTRVPFVGTEAPATLLQDGQLITRYYNFSCTPLYDAQGGVRGVINVGTEVTEQVVARRQVEQLNQELETRVQVRTRELHEQRQLLSQILGQVPAAIATLSGPAHRFSFANARYQFLVGDRVKLGQSVAEALPEVVEQGVIALLDRVYQTGEPFIGRGVMLMLEQPPGPPHQYYYDLTYLPLHDGQGQVQSILVFAVEVTEQVRARKQADTLQAALLAAARRQAQQREELYQMFAQTPVAIVLLREPAHRIDYFNPAFAEVFPPAEPWPADQPLRGHTLAQVYPRMQEAGLVRLLDSVYDTGESQTVLEMPLAELQPGSPRYITFAYQPYYEQARIVGVAAFAYDATEQVLARQEREAQRQMLATVFAQAPVAIFVLRGAAYVFEVVNRRMGQMLSMDPDAMLGNGYFDLLPGLEAQGYRQLLDQVWHTGQEYVALEQAARLPHHGAGETGYYDFTYVPLREANGHVAGIMCVATDVTTQVLARQRVQVLNDELTQTNAQLTRTNVDLDTFVYVASHDLKAPITNIEGLAQALRDTLPPAVQQEALVAHLLELLDKTIGRFQFTIAQLTDLSKLQLVHAGLAEPVELAAVVEGVCLDLAPVIAAAEAQLTVEVAADLRVSFAPGNLRSIVYNLLSNAVKYRDPARPAQVWVRAEPRPGVAVLTVQDNGLGLSDHQQQRLFGLFQRLHDHVEGTGVGLYITKRLVENGGGTIVVASQVDVGTTFTLTFPA